jgi:hypothetical protein
MTNDYNSNQAPEEGALLSSSENSLLAEKFDEFKEALETLYILANMAGRNNFNKNWPHVAKRVLGEELIDYDLNGAKDLERRSELEVEAETRRIELLEALDNVEDKSVHAGALQIEYVQQLVGSLGREMALYVYAKPIVDRFIPPSAEDVTAAVPAAVEEQSQARTHDDAVSDSDFESIPDLGSRVGEPTAQEFKIDDVEKAEDAPVRPPSISAKPRTAGDMPAPSAPVFEEEDMGVRPIDTTAPQGRPAFDTPEAGAIPPAASERELSPLEIEQAKLMEQRAPALPEASEGIPDAEAVDSERTPRSEEEALQPMTFMPARRPKD